MEKLDFQAIVEGKFNFLGPRLEYCANRVRDRAYRCDMGYMPYEKGTTAPI